MVEHIYKPYTSLVTVANLVFIILLTQYTPAYEKTVTVFYNLFYYATDVPIYSNNLIAMLPYKPYLYAFYLSSYLLVLTDLFTRNYMKTKGSILTHILVTNILPLISHFAFALSFVPVMLVSGIVTMDRIFVNFFILVLSSTLVSPLLQRNMNAAPINLYNFRFILIGGLGLLYVYLTCIITISTSPTRVYPIVMIVLQMVVSSVYVLSVIDSISVLIQTPYALFDRVYKSRDIIIMTHILVGCLFTFVMAFIDKKNNSVSMSYEHGLLDVIA